MYLSPFRCNYGVTFECAKLQMDSLLPLIDNCNATAVVVWARDSRAPQVQNAVLI